VSSRGMSLNFRVVALLGVLGLCSCSLAAAGGPLATALARNAVDAPLRAAEGVVEAVRQTVIAPQVSGAIVQLLVKPGDAVKAGQVLVRIDARAAERGAVASAAEAQAARATWDIAQKDYERQRQLQARQFISQSALDRAEAQLKSARAQTEAQLAQAAVGRTQSGYFTLTAPYSGVVAEVPVTQGDMALPGRALMTLYDPAALRVTATVPQSVATRLRRDQPVKLELPGLLEAHRWQTSRSVTVLPTADTTTHTMQVRLDLPVGLTGVTPGMFARAWLPEADDGAERSQSGVLSLAHRRILVPASAVFRRAEFSAVYVVDAQGRPSLRLVRTGRALGGDIEVLSGLAVGERVALEPLAAAQVR